jgi:CBS domain-containing protein
VKLDASVPRALVGSIAFSAGALGLARRRRRTHRRAPTIGDVMSRHPASIGIDASAQVAARCMAEDGVGALAVCDRRGRPVGVVTDRDMVLRLLAQAEDPRRTTVGDCLEGEVATVSADESLSVAVARMRNHAVRRLPVVRDGHLVGIVTQADLALHDPPAAASLQRDLTRAPRDLRSAAWLFRQPYRASPEA